MWPLGYQGRDAGGRTTHSGLKVQYFVLTFRWQFLYCLGSTLLILNDPFTDNNFFYFVLNILLCKKNPVRFQCLKCQNFFLNLPPKLQYKILCKGEDENDLNYTGADHCGLSAWSWWLVVNSETKVAHSGRFDEKTSVEKNVSSTCKDVLFLFNSYVIFQHLNLP